MSSLSHLVNVLPLRRAVKKLTFSADITVKPFFVGEKSRNSISVFKKKIVFVHLKKTMFAHKSFKA